MLVQQLSSVLPDDRPITAINIIEDIDKCPANFTVVSKISNIYLCNFQNQSQDLKKSIIILNLQLIKKIKALEKCFHFFNFNISSTILLCV